MENAPKTSSKTLPTDVKDEDFDVARYNEIAQRARLAEITLSASEFHAKIDAALTLSDPEAAIKLNYKDELTDVTFDGASGILAGTFNWKAEIKSGRSSLVRLRAGYSIFYDNLVDADESYAVAYLGKVGRFATYPYFRALFSLQSGAASLTIPPLPSLRERVD